MRDDSRWCVIDATSSAISAQGGPSIDAPDWGAVIDAVGAGSAGGRHARITIDGRVWDATVIALPFGSLYMLEPDRDRASTAMLTGIRGIVHDVNNALGVIAATTWISDEAPSLDDMDQIRAAVQRAADALRDIPDVDWPPDVDVRGALRSATGFESRAQPKGVQVAVEMGRAVRQCRRSPILDALEALADADPERDERLVLEVSTAADESGCRVVAHRVANPGRGA